MAPHRPTGAALLVGVLLVGLSTLPGEANTRAAARTPASAAPAFDHIFVILEENQDYARMVGNADTPFINGLIANNYLQTDYHGLGHGSLPNYLGLVSGSEQLQAIGWPPRDCAPTWAINPPTCAVTDPDPSNITDLIEHSGRSWRAYLQGMGQPCRWQSQSADYDIIHNPFIYFQTIEGGGAVSSQRCVDRDVDMYRDPNHTLHADLMGAATTPNFVFIVPSNRFNMHDDRFTPADSFLRDILTGSNTTGQNGTNTVNIFGSPAWTSGRSILYLLFDEDSGTRINHVVAIQVGNWVNGPRGEDGASFDHYSLLKTWETAWGLPSIQTFGGDASATPMLAAFNLNDEAENEKTPGRLTLREPHAELYAQVEARTTSPGTADLMSVVGSDGIVKVRLYVAHDGTLTLENRAAATTRTSEVAFGSGWHSVGVHVWARGDGGTCEVTYDGHPIAALSQTGGCATGPAPIGSLVLGRPGAGGTPVDVRHPVITTSRI
jgi:hypothetical protein